MTFTVVDYLHSSPMCFKIGLHFWHTSQVWEAVCEHLGNRFSTMCYWFHAGLYITFFHNHRLLLLWLIYCFFIQITFVVLNCNYYCRPLVALTRHANILHGPLGFVSHYAVLFVFDFLNFWSHCRSHGFHIIFTNVYNFQLACIGFFSRSFSLELIALVVAIQTTSSFLSYLSEKSLIVVYLSQWASLRLFFPLQVSLIGEYPSQRI